VGVEALMRWNHPVQGMISPASFIPVAEDSGLILPMGEWVMREAICQVQKWFNAGLPPITMAINISAVQFRQQDLVGHLRRMLDTTGCDPARIELELTESMLMQDAAGAVRILQELSDIGAKLAIDDFGTGYSSLSYLKQFPVDKLKLDQSFVHHLPGDTNDAVIARATINLGHSLGMEVIAEGVETEEQFAYLLAEGCDVVQGFLFGRPMPAKDLEAFLLASRLPVPTDA
jgi:EAL domain-containing protein (putative c-di-GMP-specific phosphodiesterase class I)